MLHGRSLASENRLAEVIGQMVRAAQQDSETIARIIIGAARPFRFQFSKQSVLIVERSVRYDARTGRCDLIALDELHPEVPEAVVIGCFWLIACDLGETGRFRLAC